MLFLQCIILMLSWQSAYLQMEKNKRIFFPLDGSELTPCATEEGEGVCTFQLSCHLSGGKPGNICKSKYGYGVCCLPRNTPTTQKPDVSTQEITTEPQYELITTPSATESIPVAEDEIISDHSRHACGVIAKISRPYGRIVNGTKAKFGEFPWQVSIRTYKGIQKGFEHQCGGVLLNEEWIATAAHCVARKLSQEIQVRVGEHDQSFTDEIYPHKDYRVIKKVTHPHFLRTLGSNQFAYEGDIALLRVSPSVKMRKHILPICLPGLNHTFEGRKAAVTGWGKMRLGGEKSNILQKVFVPIISNNECEKMYSAAGLPQSIPDIFLCAGFRQGGADACSGDSGGPLIITSADGRSVLVGLVSWGNGCGEPNRPGVYTRVTKFVPWILDEISKES